MKKDIEIAHEHKMLPIIDVAKKLNLEDEDLELYGRYKGKISPFKIIREREEKAKLILVTAISPTPAGEGKTTTAIGLADGLRAIGKNSILALREPSLGPVFGIKGGATGGGYAQILPMEDINLHFNGDFHAIGAANNLIVAMVDNHIYQGNSLNIDPKTIKIKRVVDMNDRQLRNVVDGLGGSTNGCPREDSFEITVASEIMAILCLSLDYEDLKSRIGNMLIAYDFLGNPIFAKDLKCEGAATALLKEAIKPNLVQTLEGTPALVHGGPFANIAHGCNSILATKLGLRLSHYLVTEAGFGADLGAEKFLDIKCRSNNLNPDCVVLVATVRALKFHGGIEKNRLSDENLEALERGIQNLRQHCKNLQDVFNCKVVISLNRFPTDTEKELDYLLKMGEDLGTSVVLNTSWAEGGKGATALAERVVEACKEEKSIEYPYSLDDSIKDKIEKLFSKVYRCNKVNYEPKALKDIENIEKISKNMPICVAKTQYSFSDNPKLLNAPRNFSMKVTSVELKNGAGFVVVKTGDIMTMPGLPKVPAAEEIDIDSKGNIRGIF